MSKSSKSKNIESETDVEKFSNDNKVEKDSSDSETENFLCKSVAGKSGSGEFYQLEMDGSLLDSVKSKSGENNLENDFDGDFSKKIEKTLLKKALGYTVNEVVEEYVNENDTLRLAKKKITQKHIPPDFSVARALLENTDDEYENLKSLTDDQLYALRDKLLKEIEQEKSNEIAEQSAK